ncbi:MAG: DegT/DnrJ/EryC1/StrS family aminotransferase [Candidatus Omnitrophica bacterium]|nr:DegT/DnrJ/EryC1/StrS family aminotransferase [Candidatus Omnitrophota bacterium]
MSGQTKPRQTFLPFSPPLLGEEEIIEMIETLRSDWITTGPRTKKFEGEFARLVGAQAALGLSSGTGALHTALAAMGIGQGDVVITTPMTFCSGVHVIEQVGATPLLVDIQRDTLNIDPFKIEENLRKTRDKKVKAILPVHFAGHPCDMDLIMDLAKRYQLFVLEDAAHAIPAKFNGRMIGAIGDLTAFSFYATKNMTTGEGGMLTGSRDLVEKARVYSLHGIDRDAWDRYSETGSWYYEVIASGFKYNMMDLQAAIGIHQMRKLPQFMDRRRQIVKIYHQAFSQLGEIEIPTEKTGVDHAWHLYILRLNLERLSLSRDQFIQELRGRNIGSSVHYVPIHLHPYYRNNYGFKPEDFPVVYEEYQRMISLPLYPKMTDEDAYDVVSAVCDIVKGFRR